MSDNTEKVLYFLVGEEHCFIWNPVSKLSWDITACSHINIFICMPGPKNIYSRRTEETLSVTVSLARFKIFLPAREGFPLVGGFRIEENAVSCWLPSNKGYAGKIKMFKLLLLVLMESVRQCVHMGTKRGLLVS